MFTALLITNFCTAITCLVLSTRIKAGLAALKSKILGD
jgi:hypothetical protein